MTDLDRLLSKLHHYDPIVRWAAARDLGDLGNRAAVPALVEALHDPGPGVRQAAASSLRHLGEGQRHPAMDKWSVWSGHGYLLVGLECYTYAAWIERAGESYALSRLPGLADRVRALAKRLLAEQWVA